MPDFTARAIRGTFIAISGLVASGAALKRMLPALTETTHFTCAPLPAICFVTSSTIAKNASTARLNLSEVIFGPSRSSVSSGVKSLCRPGMFAR
jgi:hypothetical protein